MPVLLSAAFLQLLRGLGQRLSFSQSARYQTPLVLLETSKKNICQEEKGGMRCRGEARRCWGFGSAAQALLGGDERWSLR